MLALFLAMFSATVVFVVLLMLTLREDMAQMKIPLGSKAPLRPFFLLALAIGFWVFCYPAFTAPEIPVSTSNVPLFCMQSQSGSTNYGVFSPTDTGTTSASATPVMAGYGSTISLTPKTSGIVQIYFVAHATSTTGSDTDKWRLYYGTGAAPSPGSTVTGTQIPTPAVGYLDLDPAAGKEEPGVFFTDVSGLSVNTKYWFDVSLERAAGTGAVGIDDAMAIITEVPQTSNGILAPVPCPTTTELTQTSPLPPSTIRDFQYVYGAVLVMLLLILLLLVAQILSNKSQLALDLAQEALKKR